MIEKKKETGEKQERKEKMKEKKKESKEKKKYDLEDEKIKELTETTQRIQAEFENYKKRCEKQNNDFRNFAEAELIKELLPILDNFELSLTHKDKDDFVKGIDMVYAQLFSLLEKKGLKPIKALNEKFDPALHEALLTEKSDKDGIVIEELQKGYFLNDKVLRHSKVKVGKK